MRLRFGLGFYGGEELSSHHLHRALKHTLAHARDRAANLYITFVADYGHAVPLLEVEITSAFQEARLALAVYNHAEVTRRLHVFKANVAGEQAFDRTDSRPKSRRVSILSGLLQALTAWYAPLQHDGVNQGCVDALSVGMDFVGAFDLHTKVSGFWFTVSGLETRNLKPETRNLLRSRGRGLDSAARVNLGQMAAVSFGRVEIAVHRNAIGSMSRRLGYGLFV